MTLRSLLPFAALLLVFSSCTKADLPAPPAPGKPVEEQPPVPPPVVRYDTLQLSAAISIGTTLYDSLPARVTIVSTDSTGQEHTSSLQLAAGQTRIPLQTKYVRHLVRMQHWGLSDELRFTREELQAEPRRLLQAARAPRRLLGVHRFVLVSGEWKPENFSDYTYNADGTLATATYRHKKAGKWELQLIFTDRMQYEGGKLRSALRYDEQDVHVGTTTFSFAGREATSIRQEYKGNVIRADVSYNPYYGTRQVSIQYSVDGKPALRATQYFSRGNRSGLGVPDPVYAYDGAINPMLSLHLPTIHEPLASRNNISGLAETYTGSVPVNDPYRYQYTYDGEGYPRSVIKDYRAEATKEHLYSTKTVFVYE